MSDNLLKEYSLSFDIPENAVDPESCLLETDPYLKFSCFEIGYRLLGDMRKVYSERLVEYCLAIIGLQRATNVLLKTVESFDPNDEKLMKLKGEVPDASGDFIDMAKWMRKVLGANRSNFCVATTNLLHELKAKMEEINIESDSPFLQKLNELGKTFDLSREELKTITLLCLNESNTLVDNMFYRDWNIKDYDKCKDIYCSYLGLKSPEVIKILSKTGKLAQIGIISYSSRSSRDLSLDNNLLHYLNGIDSSTLTDKFYLRTDFNKNEPLPLHQHLQDSRSTNLILQLLKRKGGTNILFHGVPGTGKTEFARSIANHLGLELFEIRPAEDEEDTKGTAVAFRKMALSAAIKILDHEKSLILVDEADSMLNLEDSMWKSVDYAEKAWLNHFLEQSNAKVIWITNMASRIEQSTRRRFNFMMEFTDFSTEKRLLIWKNQCSNLGIDFVDDQMLARLADRFQLNPGSITIALKDLKHLVDEKLIQGDEIVSALDVLLKMHQSFVTGISSSLKPMENAYFPELLNTTISPAKIIKSLRFFRENPVLPNFNILFYGHPGTGKTEYAKYVAKELGLKLLTKRASDLMSKWVGDSEKNIAGAFLEAEREEAILFLDECDSLFLNRSAAERSYEISRTNELLVAMENFRGILICSTNFKEGLDEAAGRRFTQKVFFDFMTQENTLLFFEKIFNCRLSDEEKLMLGEISCVTPGDFHVVKRRMIVEGIESTKDLIRCLREEVSHKKIAQKKIGLG